MDSVQKKLEASSNEPVSTEVSTDAGSDLALSEDVSGKISEMVGENARENASETKSSSSSSQKDDSFDGKPKTREHLKEELLKSAPALPQMRREVLTQLERQKNALEAQLKEERGKKNYHRVSILVRDLRSILSLIERVAHAGAEAMKDLWLKVIKKFA